MILIGLGANLPGPGGKSPRENCEAALVALAAAGVGIVRCSRWYCSAPVPVSDQPWFVNGVAWVDTEMEPSSLLALLHRIEETFGRERRTVNAARPLDLDLLSYHDLVLEGSLRLPHPRLHERAFVLIPLGEICPGWRHPVGGESVEHLIAALGPEGGNVQEM